jgi:hypothetical protein
MATAGQTLVQLPQEDLQKLLEEVATLRQEVLFLREEREVHQQRLALSDARIHVLEEGQKVTDVSPQPTRSRPNLPSRWRRKSSLQWRPPSRKSEVGTGNVVPLLPPPRSRQSSLAPAGSLHQRRHPRKPSTAIPRPLRPSHPGPRPPNQWRNKSPRRRAKSRQSSSVTRQSGRQFPAA